MSYDSYMQVSNGIEGESTAKGYEKWIKLYSYQFGAANPSTVSSGSTGLSSGRTSVSSFSVMMRREKATPQLFGFMTAGQHIDKIIVHLTKNIGAKGAVQKPFEIYTFENCLVEHVDWSGSGGEDEPISNVSFAYAKVTVHYEQQDTKGGTVGKPVEAFFDQTTVEVG
ncbi:MAG TPA: type VI secretion system tube protein Hcp [Candidatus Competibacteraceae bacterium]|nr:type VI secretion system tube protein Hcp [Candidatus Competibacteraceae bacterium]MCP5134362.1 type VI secretion system tube protein Hcp [Gammaproteobacteria bacterium]HPF58909.1 type VI secretion system tube protein Hcp [Candidatus Competibacteraceae bacterium]HRY18389.1 type VI secretion system tube protein Hcp [Candidatus Competibacteraceae bacterium]